LNVVLLGGYIKMIDPLTEASNGSIYTRGIISVENRTNQGLYEAHIPFVIFGERARDFANTVNIGSKVVFQGKWNHSVTQNNRGEWIPKDNLLVNETLVLERSDGSLNSVGTVFDMEDDPKDPDLL